MIWHDCASGSDVLSLQLNSVDENFWESGGLIEAYFEGGVFDWIGEISPIVEKGNARIVYPPEGPKYVELIPVSGNGMRGDAIRLDLSHIPLHRTDDVGCS